MTLSCVLAFLWIALSFPSPGWAQSQSAAADAQADVSETNARLKRLEGLMLRNLARQNRLGAALREQGNVIDGDVKDELTALREELLQQRALNDGLSAQLSSLGAEAQASRALLIDQRGAFTALDARLAELSSLWRALLPVVIFLAGIAFLFRMVFRFERRQLAVLGDIQRASEGHNLRHTLHDHVDEQMRVIWNWLVIEQVRLAETFEEWLGNDEGRRLAAAALATAPESVRSSWRAKLSAAGGSALQDAPFFKAEAMAAVVALRDAVARRWRQENDVNERVREMVREAASHRARRAGALASPSDDAAAADAGLASTGHDETKAWLDTLDAKEASAARAEVRSFGCDSLVQIAAALPPSDVERLFSLLDEDLRAEVASGYATLVQSPSRLRRAARKGRESFLRPD